MKGKAYDLKHVKLFLGDDKQQLINMITIFLSETPLTLTDLNNNLNEKNYDEVKFYAHKLKSSIDLFQINGLQDDIRTLEQLASGQEDIPSIDKYVNSITSTMEDVLGEIKKEIS
jgi:HPt (histidine-containing phosphotransfer) domain-containing protein